MNFSFEISRVDHTIFTLNIGHNKVKEYTAMYYHHFHKEEQLLIISGSFSGVCRPFKI